MSKAMPQHEFQREVLQSIGNVKTSVEKTNKDVARLTMAVIGDKDAGVEGLVSRLEKAEKYIDRDRKLKWMGAGVVSAVSFTFAKYWESIMEIFHLKK
jgi:hypothetical protein